MRERKNEIEASRGRERRLSGQGMIKVKIRLEVRMERWMDDVRLWVRTRKSRNEKETLGD